MGAAPPRSISDPGLHAPKQRVEPGVEVQLTDEPGDELAMTVAVFEVGEPGVEVERRPQSLDVGQVFTTERLLVELCEELDGTGRRGTLGVPRAQLRQRPVLSDANRTWSGADRLGRLLRGEADQDPQHQDLALLLREPVEQASQLVRQLTSEHVLFRIAGGVDAIGHVRNRYRPARPPVISCSWAGGTGASPTRPIRAHPASGAPSYEVGIRSVLSVGVELLVS